MNLPLLLPSISFHKFGEYFPGTGVSMLFRFGVLVSKSAQNSIVVV